MLSRVAQNLYWMARYVERAEDTARLISVNTHLLLDLPRTTAFGWEQLINITGSNALFLELFGQADEASVVGFLIGDLRNPGSLLCSLTCARENLRTTRDVVPREVWEEVNQVFLFVRDNLANGVSRRGRDHFLKTVIRGCQTVTGVLAGTLSHTQARTFILLGRYLERADMTSRIVDVRSANLLPRNPEELTPFEHIQWMSVLKSLTAYQMYRQQVRVRVRGPDVLRFLLQDRLFPRAVRHCLDAIAIQLASLPRAERTLAEVEGVRSQAGGADVQQLAASPDELHQFIDDLQIGFNGIHAAIHSTYFLQA
ncbi:MAG TPA: alpha-E domain-containing protein [Candidatus Competibacteraceae bacterium]|nr:alpha-E domain-containing protein [Candidatus Competibacteraceae bacterium]